MTDDKKANPWKLTPRECTVMQSLIDHGSNKAAARAMGVNIKTVEALNRQAREKMGVGSHVAVSRIQAVIVWDRWVRAHRGDVA